MYGTHLIEISKKEFDKIKIGDRLIICNNEDKLCYNVYVELNEDKEEY